MRLLTILSVLFVLSCTSTTVDQAEIVMGLEMEGENTVDIVPGPLKSTEVVKAYFKAYNMVDLEAVSTLEHDDVTFFTPNGTVISGKEEHMKLSKVFLGANENAVWDIKWSMSSEVNFKEKAVENWVTTGLELSYGPDTARVAISRIADLMIVDGKVKKGYIYQRELTESEKKN